MDTPSAASALDVRRLGRVPYAEALALQEDLRTRLGTGASGETVLLLEHPDVITFGRSALSATRSCAATATRCSG